ncbi:MAG TPA: hypothetical protein VLB87_01475 [Pyrinomonadaceae bacterium]|nr:hypothetical protein [Pyrinomonadaceae bacterium]
MNPGDLNKKLMKRCENLASWDYKVALAIVNLAALVAIGQLIFSVGYLSGQETLANTARPEIYTNFDLYYWLNRMHAVIAFGLALAAVGLWIRKAGGFLLSSAALTSVCGAYVWWYFETLYFLRQTEVTEYTRATNPFFRDMGLLRAASQVDLVILFVAAAVLLWQLRTLFGAFKLSKTELTFEV